MTINVKGLLPDDILMWLRLLLNIKSNILGLFGQISASHFFATVSADWIAMVHFCVAFCDAKPLTSNAGIMQGINASDIFPIATGQRNRQGITNFSFSRCASLFSQHCSCSMSWVRNMQSSTPGLVKYVKTIDLVRYAGGWCPATFISHHFTPDQIWQVQAKQSRQLIG